MGFHRKHWRLRDKIRNLTHHKTHGRYNLASSSGNLTERPLFLLEVSAKKI